ncbi:PA-phosphatase related-family protein DDB_G0284367 [Hondaea fermentalgiana]|uniref:PA-phosphatase related-family protein DDB_G0284367 n=1 Tax=Hondaea fermentalgiana TaxID=2315210 RepID=A0A2R5GPP6_9STRA|nr:PA-phosphatase related-family protein DDB_G0284367 [Hondaea fermentalgiana]|eukprot:GBG30593.1 PA-phosphatase related-family protein DDB_G0284367 [Hondaea fermentalgiana]
MASFAVHRLRSGDDRDQGDHPLDKLPYNLKKPHTLLYYYAADWVSGAVLGILTMIVGNTKLRARFYELTDPSFMYPYEEDTVSVTMLIVIGVALPLVILAVVEALLKYRVKSWPVVLDVHHFFLGLMQSLALGQLITVSLKVSVGRLRPSAFGRQTENIHGWNMSFPSGHTSMAFGSLTYLALFLAAKTGIFSKAGVWPSKDKIRSGDPFRGSFAIGIWVFIAPIALAIFVGATRLVDYAHDFSDVNAGAVIGIGCGWFAYQCNFPSVSDSLAALPRPLAHLHRSDPDWIRYYRNEKMGEGVEDDYGAMRTASRGRDPPRAEFASSFSPSADIENGAR